MAALTTAIVVAQLPTPRSGKILRNLLRKITNDQPFDTSATIDGPSVPAAIAARVAESLAAD